MIDALNEDIITLAAAASEIPGRSGRGLNGCTIWRWHARGIRGIRLETLMIGGIRYTSREALQRFFAATTAAAEGSHSMSQITDARESAILAAERQLESPLDTSRNRK